MLLLVSELFLVLIFLLVWLKKPHHTLLFIFTVGILLRLIFIVLSLGIDNYDLNSYRIVGDLTLRGANIFPTEAAAHHPYFPAILYLEAVARLMGQYSSFFLKAVFAGFDIGVLWLVYLFTKSRPKALLYALNPISILISSVHGQFDSIPLFFFLLSTYHFRPRHEIKGFLIMSIGSTLKTWPLFFVNPLARRGDYKWYFLLPFIVPALSVLVYAYFFRADIYTIIVTIFSYRAVWGVWGIGYLIEALTGHNGPLTISIAMWTFLAIYTVFAFFYKHKNVLVETTVIMLFFFVLTPVFGIQWLMWLAPFYLVEHVPFALWSFILGAAFLICSYLPWIPQFVGAELPFTPWIGLAVWGLIIAQFLIQTTPLSSMVKLPSSAKVTS
ncbi:hypothetical protein HGB07_03240 [Candidatus Roizmanbacteria bacterium]|nr:hypothetical protein [Candidatus Roizmanbacteria bacterium]